MSEQMVRQLQHELAITRQQLWNVMVENAQLAAAIRINAEDAAQEQEN